MDCQTCDKYADCIEQLKAAIEIAGEVDKPDLEEELKKTMRKAAKHLFSHRVN